MVLDEKYFRDFLSVAAHKNPLYIVNGLKQSLKLIFFILISALLESDNQGQ